MKKYFLIGTLMVSLSACMTVPDEYGMGDPVKPLTQTEKMQMSARNALIENQYANIKQGALGDAEKAYRAAPKNPVSAFEYAHLLRKVNMDGQAEMILKPFAINPKTASEDILIEYAKIQLKKGDFEAAQIYAQEAMVKLDTAQSRMVLGIAVDAQGHHQAAENHFRKALEMAPLDLDLKNSIKNNLALCLMSQNKNTEAQSILNSVRPAAGDLDADIISANKSLSGKL